MTDKERIDEDTKALEASKICRDYCSRRTDAGECGEKCIFWYPLNDVPFDGCRLTEYATVPGDWKLVDDGSDE